MNRIPTLFIASLAGLGAILILLSILEFCVQQEWVSRWIVPPPTKVVASIYELSISGVIGGALVQTMSAVTICVFFVAILGLPAGYALYKLPLLGRAYENLLGSLFAVPLVLLFPIFLVLFGRTYTALVACAFLHCVLPVIIYTREALLSCPEVYVRLGKVFRLSDRALFWKIMLPAASPMIFVGIRLSLIYVLIYIVGIEFLINFGGLGRLISEMYLRFEIANTYGVIAFVMILSAMFYFILKGIEMWLARLAWR